ncbi:MAG: hypothetical protein MUF54_23810 [Polyangiaceae bacterium]|jgi:hypothetical protein|nr:hypothetical protein [Polyangiaceae bacterium]
MTLLEKRRGPQRSARCELVAVASFVVTTTAACTPPSAVSSTVAVPKSAAPSGDAAVVIGWGDGDRQGWTIDHVRVDGRGRPEWDSATQYPTVFRLRPGTRTLRIYSTRPATPPTTEPLQLWSQTVQLDLARGQLLLCPVHLKPRGPSLPNLTCRVMMQGERSPSEGDAHPGRPTRVTTEEDASGPVHPVTTSALEALGDRGPPASELLAGELIERLSLLERRFEILLTQAMDRERANQTSESSESRRQRLLETTPPW